MAKKVLILSSSPRKDGNSDLLCSEFARGANQAGHHTEHIFLKDKNINYCTGCGACYQRGTACPQKDHAADVIAKMIDADIIVMATLVYFYTMCAQMKTLIDRTCACYTEISNKDFYFIMTAADDSIPSMQATLEGFRSFTYCLNGANEKGVIYGVGAWHAGEIKSTPAMEQAYEMGRTI